MLYITVKKGGVVPNLPERLETWFREAAPAVRFCSLRYVGERSESLSVRRGRGGADCPPATTPA